MMPHLFASPNLAAFEGVLLMVATLFPSYILDAFHVGIHPWWGVGQGAVLALGLTGIWQVTRGTRWMPRVACLILGYLCLNLGFTVVAGYFLYGTARDVWWHPLLVVILLSGFEIVMICLGRRATRNGPKPTN